MNNFVLEHDNFRLAVSPDLITPKSRRKLILDLEESREAYLKDFNAKLDKAAEIEKEYEKALKKKDKESMEAYDERIKPITEEKQAKLRELDGDEGVGSTTSLTFDTLKLISGIGSKEVTLEVFENLPTYKIDGFLYSVLKHCKIAFADQFAPNE